jgi:hypothetical protein
MSIALTLPLSRRKGVFQSRRLPERPTLTLQTGLGGQVINPLQSGHSSWCCPAAAIGHVHWEDVIDRPLLRFLASYVRAR